MLRSSSCLNALVIVLAACSSGTGPSDSYSILVTNPTSAAYNWTANDSAHVSGGWFAPQSGWQTVPPSGTWCVHVPKTVSVVWLNSVGAAPGANNFTDGYVHVSATAPSWTTDGSLNGFGQIASSPGPAC